MDKLEQFNKNQIRVVNNVAAMAEELVSNYYKISASQWSAMCGYDIKTLVDLDQNEIIHGPFAQIIRYEGKQKDTSLGSLTYDFYKICLQDHSIFSALSQRSGLELFPFVLYIIVHELIHIVRFSKFLQSFDASVDEKMAEEMRVHEKTRKILIEVRIVGIEDVLEFYDQYRAPFDGLRDP